MEMVRKSRQSHRNEARFEAGKPSPQYMAYAELVSRAILQVDSGVEPLHVPKGAVERLARAIQNAK